MASSPRSLSTSMNVFCDFDGPIVDVSDRYHHTYQLALADTHRFYRDFSSPQPGDLSSEQSQSGLSKARFWQMKQDRVPDLEIARQSGLQSEEIDYFLGRVVELVNCPDLLQRDRIQSGVDWALNLLRSQGFKLILVTLRDRSEATRILEQHQLRQLFTGIYGTDNSHAAYQNYAEVKTQLLAQAMKDLSVPSNAPDTWMIGDTEADIMAGTAMQIPTIGLTCGIRSTGKLRQFKPTLIKADLLSAAHYLVGMGCPQLVPLA